jgi:UDP-N-acetylmuramate--alanine ligase
MTDLYGRRIHLLGVGGVGSAPLAEILLARGCRVSGCDVRETAETRALAEKGARIVIGENDPVHVEGQDVLVHTTRLGPAARREKEAAEQAGLTVLNRPQLLSELVAAHDSIGIAGTHGKTTTTAMIGHVLVAAGWDASLLVGDGRSSRVGAGPALVAELDESDRTLPLHRPRLAVVTNVEFDHGDYYRDLEDVRRCFTAFIEGLPGDGLALLCADDPWLRDRAEGAAGARRLTYGYAEHAGYRCHPGGEVERDGRRLARLRLRVPGRHSLQNATAALAVAVERGVAPDAAAAALASFTGAKRRMERLGSWRGAVLYDDYGHLPTEVRVTVNALRELPHRRLVLVFQPHRYSRYLEARDQLVPAVAEADRTLVTEIYGAGEPNPGGVSSAGLARAAGCGFAPDLPAARAWLEREVRAGDLVLLMGAGDIRSLGDELAQPR